MVISVDFDGTCVAHEYPETGKDIGAEIVLKKLSDLGHKIICTTMRSDSDTKRHGIDTIANVKKWFKEHDIKLFDINNNPEQNSWTDSRKIYANTYIDDQFLGCPLNFNLSYSSNRAFVDWHTVTKLLIRQGFINYEIGVKILEKLEKKYPNLYLQNYE